MPRRRSGSKTSSLQNTTTEAVLEDLVQNSSFFGDSSLRRRIPTFEPQEVKSGVELGLGEFGLVSEVSELCVNDCRSPNPRSSIALDDLFRAKAETKDEELETEEKLPKSVVVQNVGLEDITVADTETTTTITSGSISEDQEQAENEHEEHVLASINTRISMAANTRRDGKARYAIKRLKTNMEQSLDAAIDLACEAMFLQSISHTNIIHLRGTVGIPGTPDFAILLDRLVMTLEDQILEWQAMQKQCQGKMIGLVGRNKEILDALRTERLLVSFDIARALEHLHHTRRILYRDIKPANCGFNVRGDVQIFDFGLARELKPHDLVEAPDSYETTGLTGSRRYMAPEVALCLPYGFKADVYSYSILFWQICALKEPFPKLNTNTHFKHVVLKNKRPGKLAGALPAQLNKMMSQAWSKDPSQRPSLKKICRILRVTLSNQRNGMHAADRSTELMNRSIRSAVGYPL